MPRHIVRIIMACKDKDKREEKSRTKGGGHTIADNTYTRSYTSGERKNGSELLHGGFESNGTSSQHRLLSLLSIS